MQLAQKVQIDIGHKNHFRVRRSLRPASVGGESKIARSKHPGLRILYIHVVHARQVAYATGYHHKALVLDGTGLGTNPYARVSVLRIRQIGHEEDLHPLVGHNARQFGELHIVTNQHADFGTIRIERLQHTAPGQSPALGLVGRDMYLLIHLITAVATAQEAYVIEVAVALQRHTPGDDIDVVADGQL